MAKKPDLTKMTAEELRAYITKLDAEIAAEERDEDAKSKAQGFTHKVVAWVHPARGDDHQVIAYYKEEPSAADIESMLKRHRSQVTNDYKVTKL